MIDVGIGTGTPELYAAFRGSRFLLVDPVAECEPVMRRILSTVEGDYAIVAATASRGSVRFRVAEDDPEASTMFVDESSPHRWDEREVAGVPLDDLVSELGFTGPFVLKADVQGAEIEVLSGASRVLEDTDAVALEVSFFEFFAGAPQVAEVVGFMKERGFVPYDVVGGHERPLDGALAQLDVVFVRQDGVCRQTNRYT